jgi:Fe-S cluster biogenesis protein NfuA
MTEPFDPRAFQARLERLDSLIQGAERFADPAARAQTREIVQALLELHGLGLERLLDHLAEAGEPGQAILDAYANDDVVAGLLLLHGIHPLDLEARVGQALESVRPYLHSHGGNVELLGVRGDVVHLRLIGSCDGCPSSAVTMQQTIEQAIFGKAPEITTVTVEGLPATVSPPAEEGMRIALPML